MKGATRNNPVGNEILYRCHWRVMSMDRSHRKTKKGRECLQPLIHSHAELDLDVLPV